jgi:PKD repeat protein
LAFTGTDGWNNATCAPQADFYTDKPVACIGEDITFFDYSSDSDVLFFEWYFDDGTSSTSPNPTKSFTSSGWHSVTLSVSNWYGIDIAYKERAVYVIPEPNVLSGLVTENFQNQEFFNNNYISRNFDFNASAWTWNNTVGYDDQACASLNAYDFESDFIDTGDNDIDELIFPAMDLDNITGGSPSLSFKYAFATQATDLAGVTDNFILYSSRNCGLTWQARNPSSPSQSAPAVTGATLVSAGNSTSSFVPATQADWKTITYNIPNTLWEPNVLFKIVFTTGEFANNLYIDNININGIVGVDEINKEVAGLNVYPNPANNSTQLSFTLSNSQDVTVVVTDLSGRVVKTELFANRVAGGNIIDLPLDAIADGMYMVSIKSENAIATQRLVVRK